MVVIFIFAALIAFAQSSTTPAGVKCLKDSECTIGECCYKKHDDLVVSKRQGTFEGYPFPNLHHHDYSNRTGVCQSYKMEGDFCSIYDAQNGYCSCNTKLGMSCKYVHEPVTINKRKVYVPGSGSFKCTSELLLS